MPHLLEVENLTVAPAGEPPGQRSGAARDHAVHEVSFLMDDGEFAGLIGERGCGKTSLFQAFVGIAPATSGVIRFRGEVVTSRRAFRRLRGEIGLLFEDCRLALNPVQPVGTTLEDSLCAERPRPSAKERTEQVATLLESVGLTPEMADRRPRELAHGEAERVALARALAADLKLLLIDDSLRSLDLRRQREFLDLLVTLKEARGFACLFAGHDFALLRDTVETMHFMSRGRLVESGPVEQIVSDPQHDFTKKLLASTLTLT